MSKLNASRIRHLIQIVPSLPPAVGGVADYAHLLAATLANHGITTEFIDCSKLAYGASEGPYLHSVIMDSLNTLGVDTAVLLHYVGYGYDRNGCPTWLADSIERTVSAGARLITLFHEVYAFGPPWTKAFWHSHRQRQIAMRLFRSSAVSLTTSSSGACALSNLDKRLTKPRVQPVFSTLGEPNQEPRRLCERDSSAVIFGLPASRKRVYRAAKVLDQLCVDLGIKEVIDAGPGHVSEPLLGVSKFRTLGAVPAHRLLDLLGNSQVGILAYPPEYIEKSTVYAAYCATGVLPVVLWPSYEGPFERFISDGYSDFAPPRLQSIANAAREWYSGHSLDAHGAIFSSLVGAGDTRVVGDFDR